jgi:signal transduction histidine kinase/DNA-binding response OmpR family regulator
MGFMKYNIDFEIMGLLVMLVIAYNFYMNYVSRTRSDRAFMTLVRLIIAAQVLDMVTAITFSMQLPELNLINLILTTAYFLCAFATSSAFERYVATYVFVDRKNRIYDIVRRSVIVIYCLHGLLNPFTKLAFYFDPDGSYQHGPLYILGYIVPGMFTLMSLYFMLRYRKRFAFRQWLSSVVFIFVVFAAMVLQLTFAKDVYLTFGLVPIALLMIMFSLETPDYRKLMKTLEELEKARQEAQKANQVKSAFLANMSHEIRTPINAVLGFDEMILRESQDEAVLEYATNIKTSGHNLLSIVNDILDLSKIEAGKMEIVRAEYDTVPMLSELLNMIAPRAREKGLTLKCEIDKELPRKLVGDDVRVSQVLANLLTNAVKYTQKGEVTLKVRVEENKGNQAVLFFAVVDTGIGIKEEHREKLFSEFGRVEEEKTHKLEGTGLGLPISAKCLRLMGSQLEMESTYGVGSTFHFLIEQGIADGTPVGDFEAARLDEDKEMPVFREDFTAKDAHVLVVDDVEMNLKVFQGLLKKSGMQIDTALSGMGAIDLIHKNRYDCVFMDHQMPEMDGIETLAKLREDPEARLDGVPVIALTANAIAGAKETYLSQGFSDYLSKPIDGWALSAMLQKWLPKEKIQIVSENAEDEVLEFYPEGEEPKKGGGSKNAALQKLEQAGFDVQSALVLAMNEEAFYLELVSDFAKEAPEMQEFLAKSFDKRDWKNYEIKVHALKSAAKTIGAAALSEEARTLEHAAKEGKEDVILSGHAPLMEHYRSVVGTIKNI